MPPISAPTEIGLNLGRSPRAELGPSRVEVGGMAQPARSPPDDSPDPQLETRTMRARRPDPEQGAALEANRPYKDAGVVRQPFAPHRRPYVPVEHLQLVR